MEISVDNIVTLINFQIAGVTLISAILLKSALGGLDAWTNPRKRFNAKIMLCGIIEDMKFIGVAYMMYLIWWVFKTFANVEVDSLYYLFQLVTATFIVYHTTKMLKFLKKHKYWAGDNVFEGNQSVVRPPLPIISGETPKP